jgi:BirA family biotin operon repressor/biotin-[acetyl-CoA-carboxylase] ligase
LPVRPVASEAEISAIGHRIESYAVVDSTNDVALDLMRQGAAHGTIVTAEEQRAGRGRRGRTWWSPRGNLYASIIVRPDVGTAVGQLAFVTAVAASGAVGAGIPIRFKWPNDLLVDGRKLGGILIDAESDGAVIGLGINVASAPDGTPYPVTSLTAIGYGTISVGELLASVCRSLETWYVGWKREGFSPVRDAWLARAAGMGETMAVRSATTEMRGVFAGLDGDGALLLETADGRRRVTSGEVVFGQV